MIPESNIISGKASVASIDGAGGSDGGSESLRKFLGSKEHLNQLERDLNATKIITVQDYKSTRH